MSQQYVPSLGEFFGQLALKAFDKGYVRKKALRKEWVVPGGAPMVVGALVFQSGAVLGHARQHSADALGRLTGLSGEDSAVPLADSLRAVASGLMGKIKREAESLHDVWNLSQFPEVDLRDLTTLQGLTKGEIRLGHLMQILGIAAIYGISFGLGYPDEFEELWHRSFETPVDPANWTEMRSHGLAIPERQELYPLAIAERDNLDQTGAYVRAYRPELLESLNLESYGTE